MSKVKSVSAGSLSAKARKGKISEIFFSVQGEGPFAGAPSNFVRFYGCPYRCPYCDTMYAVRGNKFTEMTAGEIGKKLRKGFPVVITGGEPTFQIEFLKHLVKNLKGFEIHLETAGFSFSENFAEFFGFISFHINPPFSGRHKKFIEKIAKTDFCVKIVVDENVSLKFVSSAANFLRGFEKGFLILQPASFGKKIPKKNVEKTMKLVRKIYPRFSRLRFIPQIHKFLNLK